MEIYLPIQQTDTVFTRILDNLYNNNDFKQNITRLELGNDNEKKKAFIIKKTVSNIKIYGDTTRPLLLARDVGILMGISNIKFQLKYYNSSEKIIGLYQLNNGKTSEVEYLTWKGFIRAASNSRSAMSDIFREFIYELVAECINDNTLLEKVTKRVIDNNPELLDKAITEFDENLNYYKLLYQKEIIQKQLLQENLDNEIQLRLIAEEKQANAELTNLINENRIKYMLEYKNRYEQALLNIYEFPSNNEQELNILRQKFLKPLYIYVPHPKLYEDWTLKQDNEIMDFIQYIPNYSDHMQYILDRIKTLKTSNDKIDIRCLLPETEYCYFYLYNNLIEDKLLIHIATEWIFDKKHLETIFDEMNKECEKINTKIHNKNRTIYYSSLEEIHQIISGKMIELNLIN
jgi:hypothetical protein